MLDILTWMWHDPLLQGSRGTRPPGAIVVPSVRPDLLALDARRRRRAAFRGLPAPVPQHVAPAPVRAPDAPRFFKPEHVVQLARRVREVLPVPHRFVCICDEVPTESNGVTWIRTPAAALEMSRLRSPEGNRFPSCYRRLWAQSEEAAQVLSERVLLIDIDLIPVRDWSPIVNRPEPFVGWRPYRDWGRQTRIGGGIYLFTPGANTRVWTDFYTRPQAAIAEARQAGLRGSDQAWLSYKLAGKVPVYGRDAGIYSIRDLGSSHDLPADARLVQFNGPIKPWGYRGPAAWVSKAWNGK